MADLLQIAMDHHEAKRTPDQSLPVYDLMEATAEQPKLDDLFDSLRSHVSGDLMSVRLSAGGRDVSITIDVVIIAMEAVHYPDDAASTSSEVVWHKQPDWVVHGWVADYTKKGASRAFTNAHRVWCFLEFNDDQDRVSEGLLQFLDRQPGGYMQIPE